MREPAQTERWAKKECFRHAMNLFSSTEKNGTVKSAGRWTPLEIITMNERSQSQNGRSRMFLRCGSSYVCYTHGIQQVLKTWGIWRNFVENRVA